MDIATIIGLILGFGLVVGSIAIGGAMGAFLDIPSVMITVGGSISALLINFPLSKVLGVFSVVRKAFTDTLPSTSEVIEQFKEYATTARRDGLLALESRAAEIQHPFLALGIQLTVDGTNPEVLESVLRTEMEALNNRHKDGKLFLDQWGKTGPSFGMIGTLLGLIIMLGNLSDPEKLGPGMAVALITTLYGALLANVICLPFSEKLNQVNRQELAAMEIIIRGVLAIQAGDSPRVVHQKLSMFIPPKARTQLSKGKAA